MKLKKEDLGFWFIITLGMISILGMIGLWFVIFWSMNKFLVVIPLIIVFPVRKILYTYIKGIITFDRSEFPTFSNFN